ncbi:putative phage abortive infection protein [compost metagenome]
MDNLRVDLEEIKEVNPLSTILQGILSSVTNISIQRGKTVFEGRPAFEAVFEHIAQDSDETDSAITRYKHMQDQYNHVLGHYFRNLYQALKVVNSYSEAQLTADEKRKYTSIMRAQLSTTELALLFLNCINGVSDQGQFRNLLVEYAMLEHLPFKETPQGYTIAHRLKVSRKTFDQFKEVHSLPVNLHKPYGGAFGKNGGNHPKVTEMA